MNRRDISFIVSLTIALGVIFGLYAFGMRAFRHELGLGMPLPGWEKRPRLVAAEKLAPLPMMDLGESLGTGHGVNRSPGEEPLQSTISDPYQEQALMTRDAFGARGKNGSLAASLSAQGDNGDNAPKGAEHQSAEGSSARRGQKADVDPFVRQTDPAENFSPHSKTPLPPKLANAVDPANKSQETPKTSAAMSTPQEMIASVDDSQQPLAAVAQKPSPAPAPPPPTPGAAEGGNSAASATAENQGGVGGTPGASAAPGSPGPKSDFESVPVTNMQAVQFRSGRLVPRSGRKILTRTLPDISITGWDDLRFVADAYVTLRLKIDQTGNVVDARVLHGTGSDNIDLPCQRAAATWWFEPQKNPKTGQLLISDTIVFTIAFR